MCRISEELEEWELYWEHIVWKKIYFQYKGGGDEWEDTPETNID